MATIVESKMSEFKQALTALAVNNPELALVLSLMDKRNKKRAKKIAKKLENEVFRLETLILASAKECIDDIDEYCGDSGWYHTFETRAAILNALEKNQE
jgi:predicted NACHT family NTPase